MAASIEIEEHEEEPGTVPGDGHDEVATAVDDHEGNADYIPAPYSWMTLILMVIIPLWWYRRRSRRKATSINT